LVPKGVKKDDIRIKNFIKWFDPLGYAQLLDKPVLQIIGTHDEFFDLTSINITFTRIKSNKKNLVLWPNEDHLLLNHKTKHLAKIIIKWISSSSYPSLILKDFSQKLTTIRINISGNNLSVKNIVVYFKGGEAGGLWHPANYKIANSESIELTTSLIFHFRVFVYVSYVDANGLFLSSTIVIKASSNIIFALIYILSIAFNSVLIAHVCGIQEVSRFIKENKDRPQVYIILTNNVLLFVPQFTIHGSLVYIWDIIYFYGIILNNPEFLYFGLIFIIVVLNYLAMRNRLFLYLLLFFIYTLHILLIVVMWAFSGYPVITFSAFALLILIISSILLIYDRFWR